MKRGDIVIIALIAAAVAVSSVLLLFQNEGSTVTVKQDNKIIYEGSINKDTEVALSGNTVIIDGGFAYIKNANCKNEICVHTGRISKTGESIICLPNRVIVEIE